MSARDLQDRVRLYETLLDQLHESSDSERSRLLAVYAKGWKESAGQAVDTRPHAGEISTTEPKTDGTSAGDQHATLAVLGCGWLSPGTLGAAILSGIISSLNSSAPSTPLDNSESPPRTLSRFIACVTRSPSVKRLESTIGPMTTALTVLQNQNLEAVQRASTVLLACKPKDLSSVLLEPGVREALSGKLLISILAGVSVSQIEETLYGSSDLPKGEQRCRIVRVMPNTASVNGESMTVIASSNPSLPPEQSELVTWMFARIGRVVHLPASVMDASTALCGSGPAFFALMLEAMADGAVAMGIPRAEAQEMAAQTMRGCAGMVLRGQHPALVREKVSTPGGCTIGGLLVLEEGSLRGTIARGVREATVVASQLGKGVQGVNGTWGRSS
ncbi:MAG: hypothetical protein Q9191_000839 [Dirinaria sp. TL-2023a]